MRGDLYVLNIGVQGYLVEQALVVNKKSFTSQGVLLL